MTTGAEALVRRACQLAESNVMDVQGFGSLFAADGVFNAIGGDSYRGEHLGDLLVSMSKFIPDVHRELYRVHAVGKVVAIDLSIRGTFTGPFETPAGVIQPTAAKLAIPCADISRTWRTARSGVDCHPSSSVMLTQLGVHPDFTSAVKAQAAVS
jgi:hypothetical protein